jgi:hypothetical protein
MTSIYLSIYLFPLLSLGELGIRETIVTLKFLSLRQSIGRLVRGISPLQGRYLTQTQNKRIQISMP